MQFNFRNKHNNRRFNSNNIISFGKSSCKIAATPSALRSLHIPFSNNQGYLNSCNTKAKDNLIKIHFRSFRSWRTCLKFKKNLKRRFNRFSNNRLFLYPNIAHTKIRYFYIKRKKLRVLNNYAN